MRDRSLMHERPKVVAPPPEPPPPPPPPKLLRNIAGAAVSVLEAFPGPIAGLLVLGLIVAIAFALTGGDKEPRSSASVASDAINQVGFFRNPERGDKLKTFEMTRPMSEIEVFAFAKATPYTEGAVMLLLFYDAGSRIPRDGVTLAKNFLDAARVLDTPGLSKWHYVYSRELGTGTEHFVDCTKLPTDSLCRINP
jgi:hypothetical protein